MSKKEITKIRKISCSFSLSLKGPIFHKKNKNWNLQVIHVGTYIQCVLIKITYKVSRNYVQMLTQSCADKKIRIDSKKFKWSGVICFEIKGFQRRPANP